MHRASSRLSVVVAAFALLAVWACETWKYAHAVDYDVLGAAYSSAENAWTIRSYSEITITTSDRVIFQWSTGGGHNVFQITEADFANCQLTGATALSATSCGSGSSCATFDASSLASSAPTVAYFMCSNHCNAASGTMLLKVNVNSADGSSSSPTTPTSSPAGGSSVMAPTMTVVGVAAAVAMLAI